MRVWISLGISQLSPVRKAQEQGRFSQRASYDLGMSSRELKDYEKELLSYEEIAKDEIVVIVQTDNPLENISSKDLKAIYTGSVLDWKDLKVGQ